MIAVMSIRQKLWYCLLFNTILLFGREYTSKTVCTASVILLQLEKPTTKTNDGSKHAQNNIQFSDSPIDDDDTELSTTNNRSKLLRIQRNIITNDNNNKYKNADDDNSTVDLNGIDERYLHNESYITKSQQRIPKDDGRISQTRSKHFDSIQEISSEKSSGIASTGTLFNGISRKRFPMFHDQPRYYPFWYPRDRNKALIQNFIIAFNINHSSIGKMRQYVDNILLRTNQRPSNVMIGAAALVGVTKIVTSEPIRRCCYFWSQAGPIIVHYRFAKWWMRMSNTERTRRDYVFQTLHEKYCHRSLEIILKLKGLYVKIGQILSSRPDFMPKEYVELFSTLQDSVPQWPVKEIEHVIRRSLKSECGLEYDDIFESMDPIALGSASIGQVHKATMRDEWLERYGRGTFSKRSGSRSTNTTVANGKYVAIKIMHPGAQERFANDFQVFRWLCRVTLPGWKSFLDELERQVITNEFDYRNEAASLRQVRQNMAKSVYASRICVPEPLEELCCKQVLVMEYLNGKRLIDAIGDDLAEAFNGKEKADAFLKLRRKEVITGTDAGSDHLLKSTTLYGKLKLLLLFQKCRECINLLVDVQGYQIFVNGCWNGDPHAGNFLRLQDGRIGLIDYGQTIRINNTDRLLLAKIITAIAADEEVSTSKSDSSDKIATAMYDAGFTVRYDDNDMMTTYAKLFFDSDEESVRQGCATPQQFFARLMFRNPLTTIPDSAVFVGRVSFLFRGLGHAIGSSQVRTAKRWANHAKQALDQRD